MKKLNKVIEQNSAILESYINANTAEQFSSNVLEQAAWHAHWIFESTQSHFIFEGGQMVLGLSSITPIKYSLKWAANESNNDWDSFVTLVSEMTEEKFDYKLTELDLSSLKTDWNNFIA